MTKGKYIVIEGPEGVGKSTQAQMVAYGLKAAGLPVKLMREPDSQNDLTARAIRNITQDPRYPMSTKTEVLLYNAARSQSLDLIKQNVNSGIYCIVDRSFLSTLAIQYYGRGDIRDYTKISEIISFAVGDMEPDLTVVLDAETQTLKERIKPRNQKDRFDNLDEAFLERVRAGYLWEANQRRYPIVYSTSSPEKVFQDVWKHVTKTLAERQNVPEPSEAKSLAEILATKPLYSAAQTQPKLTNEPKLPEEKRPPVIEAVSFLVTEKLQMFGLNSELEKAYDQKNSQGYYKYYYPPYLKPEVAKRYRKDMNRLFKIYTEVILNLEFHYSLKTKAPNNPRNEARKAARSILPAASVSSVKIDTSLTNLEHLQITLLSDPLKESINTGKKIVTSARDIQKNTPKSPNASSTIGYYNKTNSAVQKLTTKFLSGHYSLDFVPVTLIDYWPHNELDIVADMLYPGSTLSLKEIKAEISKLSYQQKVEVIKTYLREKLTPGIRPGEVLSKVHYSLDIVCDYRDYLKLQRKLLIHNQQRQLLTPRYGYDIPKLIEDAGCTDLYEECFAISLALHSYLEEKKYPLEAQYATLLGHRVRFEISINAQETLSFLGSELMVKDKGSYKQLVIAIYEKIAEVHPILAESVNNK